MFGDGAAAAVGGRRTRTWSPTSWRGPAHEASLPSKGTTNWAGLSIAAALGLGVALAVSQLLGFTPLAQDAYVYHRASPGDLYDFAWGNGPYQYSPAFADALSLVAWMPLRAFTALFQLGLVLVLTATIRGWAMPVLLIGYVTQVPPFSWVAGDIAMGNIHVLFGAIAVFGLRWPALWSFVILSKVTPGVGLVWFVARGEWRNLAIALSVTAGIAALSFLWLPGDWFAWARHLAAMSANPFPGPQLPVPLWVRLLTGAALVWWGGRTDRPWTVPLAVGWCIPIPYTTMVATMVAASWYLRRSSTSVESRAARSKG